MGKVCALAGPLVSVGRSATLCLPAGLPDCPSGRGITIRKARLSKNKPRKRYFLTVVGCLFILDCPLISNFSLILFETVFGKNHSFLPRTAKTCQYFFEFLACNFT